MQHQLDERRNRVEEKAGNKMCQKRKASNSRGSTVIIFLSGMAFATFLQAFLASSSSTKGTTISTTPSSFLKGSRIPKGSRRFGQVSSEDEGKILMGNQGAENEANRNGATCGLFYFYHVGKCGGTSVSKWMRKLTKANPEELEFYNWWHQSNNTQFDWRIDFNEIDTKLRSGYVTTSSSHASNTENTSKNWIMLHHHHGSPGLRYMMPKLQEWKQILEKQGCDLIMTTTLRDPMSRAKSVVQYRNLPKDEFYDYFKGTGFSSQASYLLHNRYVKNLPPEFTRMGEQYLSSSNNEAVVDEIVNYLKEFDIVGRTESLDDFIFDAESVTKFDQLQHSKDKVQFL